MRGLAVVVLLALASPAAADGGRVALVDTRQLYGPSGIATWVAAKAKLEAEEPKFNVAESPDGTTMTPQSDVPLMPGIRSDRERQRDDARRKAWWNHWDEVMGPIHADVMRALDAYAKAHGVALVLDRAQLGNAIVIVADGVDITDAFIKDYNAKAKPATK